MRRHIINCHNEYDLSVINYSDLEFFYGRFFKIIILQLSNQVIYLGWPKIGVSDNLILFWKDRLFGIRVFFKGDTYLMENLG